MMFYEGKKSMSMISWRRKGTQANIYVELNTFFFLLPIVIFFAK